METRDKHNQRSGGRHFRILPETEYSNGDIFIDVTNCHNP